MSTFLTHVPKNRHALVFENFQRILRTSGCILMSLGIGELEIVEEYKPYGVPNYCRNADPKIELARLKKLGFQMLFEEVMEQGGEKWNWIIARKVKDCER